MRLKLNFLVIVLIFLASTLQAQYVPTGGYGVSMNRIKPTVTLHLPVLPDTSGLHTTDTSAQFGLYNGTLYYHYGHWRSISAAGGGGAVSSVFGRTGAVVAQVGDYSSYYYPLTDNPAGYKTTFGTLQQVSDVGNSTSTAIKAAKYQFYGYSNSPATNAEVDINPSDAEQVRLYKSITAGNPYTFLDLRVNNIIPNGMKIPKGTGFLTVSSNNLVTNTNCTHYWPAGSGTYALSAAGVLADANGDIDASALGSALSAYISSGPTGAAGGDLGGTYPNPTVAQLNGQLPSYYLDRSHHTGTQSASTITGITASTPMNYSGNNISINNAAADGSTKGAASFGASDFDASSGNITLDYTNGQKATGSVPGFLSAADWTTFNGKGSGTVTSFGKTDGYGISSSVTNSTTTPNHTIAVDTSASGLSGKYTRISDSANNFTKIGFVPTQTYTLPLPFYYDYTWSATTSNSYVNSGLSAASVSSNKVLITGNGNNYSQTYYKNVFSYVEKWEKADTVIINSTISATTYGIGSGITVQGSSTYNMGYIDLSTGVDAGKLKLVYTGGTVAATSSSAVTFATNDTLILKFSRSIDTLNFTVTNKFTGSTATVQYITSTAFVYNNTIIHKGGTYTTFVKGGQYTILGTAVRYLETANAPLAIFGDSKGQGYYAGSWAARFGTKLNNNFVRTINLASSGDAISDLLARINDIILLKPKQVILEVGHNDVAQSRTIANIATDYTNLVGRLNAVGIKVFHICPYSSGVNLYYLDSFLRVTYPADYIGDVYTRFAAMSGTLLAADGTHPNAAGNDSIYQIIVRSGKIAKQSYDNDNQINNLVPLASRNVKDVYGVVAIDGNSPTGSQLVIGTPTGIPKAVDLIQNGRIARFNWLNTQPLLQWYRYDGATELGRIQMDSLDNVLMGKDAGGSLGTGAGDNTIIGFRAGIGLNSSSSSNTIVGSFGNGAGGSGARSGMVLLGNQGGYYETRSNKFYLANSSSQVLQHGDFSTGQLIINPLYQNASYTSLSTAAQLEVQSTTRGFLPPRMTTTQRDAITMSTTIANITTTAAGSGQTNGTYTLSFSGGGGSGAAGTVTISGGTISSTTITNFGSGYTSAPTATYSGAGGSAGTLQVNLHDLAGMIIYNTTTNQPNHWNGTAWVATTVTSGSYSSVGTATTTFTVTIATQANTTYKVQVTPTSLLAVGGYATNKTTTSFDWVVPAATGTVSFDWGVTP